MSRTLLSLVLAVVVVTAAGGMTAMAQTNGAATTTERTASDSETVQQTENYTRLYIEDQHKHLELQPGETDSVTITVENGDDEAVDLSPHAVVSPRGQPPIEKRWLTIETDNTTLAAGETSEFNVTISVPDDAEIRRYGGTIALTDERIQLPRRPGPPRPVHGVSLNVEVWQEPTVHVNADRHLFSQVQAGESFSTNITIENTGEQAVPLNPQMNTDDRRRHSRPGERERLDRSWVSIDSPSEIDAGETETVEVTVAPPAGAERGNYNAEVDLGLTDPARNEDRSYWQEISLRFQVWTQPDNPFETGFEVTEDVNNATLELSTDGHTRNNGDGAADFDVTFVSPDGSEIVAERVQVVDTGHVSLGDERRIRKSDGTYATRSDQQTFRYRVTDPEAGMWSVRIMPENTMDFEYEITRNEG
jgi:hypothetical protein